MKLNKKKVFTLAIAVCLIATLSLGSLAWFTDTDFVTNDFHVAGSEDDPDDIFSVDVWENGPDGRDEDGIKYPNILPGDVLQKEVNIENTGSYDQYIRAIVTVSDASIWQEIFGVVYVPLDKIVENLNTAYDAYRVVFDADADTLTYVLYYQNILKVDAVSTLFTDVVIPEALTREQAAAMKDGFVIGVVAEAVQTENVGANAVEAFKTVGKAVEAGEHTVATTAAGLKAALQSGTPLVTLNEGGAYAIDYDVSNVTIDADGKNASFAFTGVAKNVVVTGIKDDPASTVSNVNVKGALAGSSVTVKDCVLYSNNSTTGAAIAPGPNCDLVVDNCTITREDTKTYGIYNSGASGSLTVTNCTFEGFTSWAIQVNNKVNGNLVIDGCTFNTPDGVVKVLSGVSGNFTFTNNTLVGCKGHDAKGEDYIISVTAAGTTTKSNNTLDGVAWTK